MHAEDIEIVRGHFATKKLNGIAQSGQSEWNSVFAAETVENRLAIPVVLKARHRHREFQQFTLHRIRIHVHDTLRILEWRAAQKKIVDQTKDSSVQADPQCQSD